jgi:pilus assembly protein CpaC
VVGAPEANLDLETGKGRLIRLSEPAAAVFVADPKVADVQVKSPTLVYVFGRAPGSTSLFAVDRKEQMIANLAVNVGFDVARLKQMIAKEAPDARVEVASANGAMVLSGVVSSATEGDDVLRLAELFVPGEDKDKAAKVINRLSVDAPNQVNLRVEVAEVSRQALKVLDVNWQSAAKIGASGIIGWATGPQIIDDATQKFLRSDTTLDALAGAVRTGTVSINTLIEALERKQLVTILAQPNLTAVSGQPASFLAGGEYPVPVPQGLNEITIVYKQYGVSLTFVATVLDGGRISLNVRPEVSQLSTDGAITLNNITVPALTTRRAETTVELGSGQSFAIAGLLQNNINQDLKKFPGLGDVPVLGPLFRSRSFQRNESELVIIVTPYLVQPSNHRLATPMDHLVAAGPAASDPTPSATAAAPEAKADPSKKS